MEGQAPVKEGEMHNVTIQSVGEKGDGIARVAGFVLFVPNTKKNDYVKVKITKVLAKVGFAEVVEKLERKQKPRKFMHVTADELEADEPEQQFSGKDTEDFGSDLEDDDE